jgi:nucleoside-diphosphate-sugar epimerase
MHTNGCHIINIANEAEWCIKDLAHEIKALTKSNSEIIYLEAPKKRYDYEVERRVGSSEKLKSLTNFKPETTLTQGLSLIFEQNYKH